MSRVTALALYTTTFLSAFAACAIAQTPAGNDFDIVVTAEKREASVNSVPMSITAVTGEALQRQNITQVRDLERVATGFSYIEGTFAAPVYSMRGVGFNDSTLGSRPTVSVYVDETPLPFSILTRAASLDVQRVEVLKGPQGTLFGQNATGGAINYIAAKPGDVFETGFDVTAGNYGAANFGGFVSGPITDTLGGRMAIRYEHRDGWQESVSRPGDRLGEVAFGEARGMLVWRPTDQFSAQLSVTGYLDRSETQAAQYLGFHQLTAGASLDPPIDSVALMAPAPQENDAADWLSGEDYRRHNKFLQTSLRMDYDLAPDLRVTSLTSYITYTQQHHQGYDGTQYGFGSFTTHGNIHSFFQEFRLTGDTGDRLHWILGANYGRDSAWQFDDGHTFSTASQQALLPFGTFINYGQKLNQEFENWAVFANGDLQLTNALKAHAGVRYTEARDAAVSCSVNTDGAIGNALGGAYNYFRGLASLPPNAPIPIGGCVTTDEFFAPLELHSTLDEDNTSWRLGLDWSPMRDLLIYGNVSDGFKAGSFPIVSALRDIQLQPAVQEELLAYEIGVKATLMDRLHVDAAVFDYEYTNKQVRGRTAPLIPFGALETLVNVPESRITGAEVQLIWRPLEGLTVNAGATYLQSEIQGTFCNYNPYGNDMNTAGAANPGCPAPPLPSDHGSENYSGDRIPLTPEIQSVVSIDYAFPLNENFRGFVGASASYRGETNAAFGNLPEFKVDAYTTVDLRAGVETEDGRWRLSIWGNNVTDEYYWTNVFHGADTNVRFTGLPAIYGATLTFRH